MSQLSSTVETEAHPLPDTVDLEQADHIHAWVRAVANKRLHPEKRDLLAMLESLISSATQYQKISSHFGRPTIHTQQK